MLLWKEISLESNPLRCHSANRSGGFEEACDPDQKGGEQVEKGDTRETTYHR